MASNYVIAKDKVTQMIKSYWRQTMDRYLLRCYQTQTLLGKDKKVSPSRLEPAYITHANVTLSSADICIQQIIKTLLQMMQILD
jgi:hypothetical protein